MKTELKWFDSQVANILKKLDKKNLENKDLGSILSKKTKELRERLGLNKGLKNVKKKDESKEEKRKKKEKEKENREYKNKIEVGEFGQRLWEAMKNQGMVGGLVGEVKVKKG